MGRIFRNIKEAEKTWRREAEEALLKRGLSGILCECCCYRRNDEIKSASPIRTCTLLIPEKIYNDYVKYTVERHKDPTYGFPYVAVLAPGYIRVRFYGNERDDYTTKQDLCGNSLRVEELLERHLGKKIRLGKNILV